MMDHKKTKEELLAEKTELLAKLKQLESPQDFGSDVDDSDGIEALEAEQFSNQLAEAQAVRDRLSEIEEEINKSER